MPDQSENINSWEFALQCFRMLRKLQQHSRANIAALMAPAFDEYLHPPTGTRPGCC